MHRFLISAAHKSSGKTTISIGVAAALHARGLTVQAFKKGPDYIDPLWLGCAAHRPCHNLDFWISPHREISDQFARHGHDADVCLVEGNVGLYDGLDLDGSNSNAALARLLDLPVILVLDSRGMTRGVAPLILGYQAFDTKLNIAGVILNQLGGRRHEAKLRAVIEHYTDVKVVGAVQRNDGMAMTERHLGLIPANEMGDAERHVKAIASFVADQVDLDRLLELTRTNVALNPMPTSVQTSAPISLRIAIAQDDAFGFYYADDLDALRAAGAELVAFDALHDPHLPDADALFIGGGFPECHMETLEANVSLRKSIREAIEAGLPTYAECGGLMYLARSITWKGQKRAMVGVIDGDIVMHDKPIGRGYVTLTPTAEHPWRGVGEAVPLLQAHEFHYSDVENLDPATRFAYTMSRGHGVDGQRDGIIYKNLLASYTHLRSSAGCDWPAKFMNFARRCRSEGLSEQGQELPVLEF